MNRRKLFRYLCQGELARMFGGSIRLICDLTLDLQQLPTLSRSNNFVATSSHAIRLISLVSFRMMQLKTASFESSRERCRRVVLDDILPLMLLSIMFGRRVRIRSAPAVKFENRGSVLQLARRLDLHRSLRTAVPCEDQEDGTKDSS